MKSTNKLAALILIFSALILIPGLVFAGGGINWNSHDQGLAKAKQEKKKVLLYIHSDTCVYCTKMEKATFADKKNIAFANKKFIPVHINMSKESIGRKYNPRGVVPFLAILDEEGKKIAHQAGYLEPELFLNILKYFDSGSHKTMAFNEFLKGK